MGRRAISTLSTMAAISAPFVGSVGDTDQSPLSPGRADRGVRGRRGAVSTIFPSATVDASTDAERPADAVTIPAVPLTGPRPHQVTLVDRSHSSARTCHSNDSRKPADVTRNASPGEPDPMGKGSVLVLSGLLHRPDAGGADRATGRFRPLEAVAWMSSGQRWVRRRRRWGH
jgi:hypothetical protein